MRDQRFTKKFDKRLIKALEFDSRIVLIFTFNPSKDTVGYSKLL